MTSDNRSRVWGFAIGMIVWAWSAPLWAQDGELSLTLNSTPAQAVARVDGKIVCYDTPCTVRVAKGRHEIDMQLGDHRILSKSLTLTQDTTLNWKLDANVGYLSLRADKEGASVKIDGRGVWKLPVSDLALTPGAHTLVVEARCYKSETQSVTLGAKAKRQVEFKLKDRQGTLRLTALDSEGKAAPADVYLGDKKHGTHPGQFHAAGLHAASGSGVAERWAAGCGARSQGRGGTKLVGDAQEVRARCAARSARRHRHLPSLAQPQKPGARQTSKAP